MELRDRSGETGIAHQIGLRSATLREGGKRAAANSEDESFCKAFWGGGSSEEGNGT